MLARLAWHVQGVQQLPFDAVNALPNPEAALVLPRLTLQVNQALANRRIPAGGDARIRQLAQTLAQRFAPRQALQTGGGEIRLGLQPLLELRRLHVFHPAVGVGHRHAVVAVYHRLYGGVRVGDLGAHRHSGDKQAQSK